MQPSISFGNPKVREKEHDPPVEMSQDYVKTLVAVQRLSLSIGQLFSTGWNTKGQLGLGSDIQIVESFTGVELPEGNFVPIEIMRDLC